MKLISLTQGKFAMVDDEDYAWLNQFKWAFTIAKKKNTGYAMLGFGINGRLDYIYMHRLIMNFPENFGIDHKDRNGLNNQKSNLRICNPSQSSANQTRSKKNTSGFKGVCFRHKRKLRQWQATINFQRKYIYLGYFNTAEEAHEAYKKAAVELFGEFARFE